MRSTTRLLGAAALGAATLGACGEGAGALAGPACGDPARGPALARFADATAASGVDFQYASEGFEGGGLAVVDLDGDGLPELVAGRRTGGVALFGNLGGLRFAARADTGLPPDAAVSAIGAADLDNDGDVDLVLAGAGVARVMANRGDGRFDEAARLDGVGATAHVLPVDLDGDGLLDLYLSSRDVRSPDSSRNRLYRNRGGLALEPADAPGGGLSWSATALDFDGDGDLDLYVANDTLRHDFGELGSGGPDEAPAEWPVDLLLRNDGPGPDGAPLLVDVAAAQGLAAPRSSMGGLLADLDGDGGLDLYVPDYGAKKLFARDPDGGYVDRAAALGLTGTARRNAGCGDDPRSPACLVLTWSAAIGDFDLDGADELLLVNGETVPGDAPPALGFARGGEPAWHEVSPELTCMDARGLVATDLDGDGDQDAVVSPREGPLSIYENRGAPAPGSWLRATLRGRASNRDGAGAVVTARFADGRIAVRAVGAGGVVHSAGPAEAVFGLGAGTLEEVEVRWPSGRRTSVARPPAGALTIEEEP